MPELELLGEIQAHEEPVWAVSTHSSLPLLATCSSDKTSKVYDISDLNNIRAVTTLDEQTHTKTIRSVSFKPSTTREYPTLALGSFDSTCSVWGADTPESEWELLAVIEGHENEVKCIDWSLDGKYLATCARDKTIWVWETDEMNEEFECIAILSEHEGDVKFVKWNNINGEHSFLSCSYDDTLRIWRQDDYDEDEFNCVGIIRFECTVWSATWIDEDTVACSTDGGQVLMYERASHPSSSDGLPSTVKKVEEWKISPSFKVANHNGPVYSIVSKKGVLVSVGSDGVITKMEKKEGEWRVSGDKKLGHGVREINGVAITNEGVIVTCGDDGVVRIWR